MIALSMLGPRQLLQPLRQNKARLVTHRNERWVSRMERRNLNGTLTNMEPGNGGLPFGI